MLLSPFARSLALGVIAAATPVVSANAQVFHDNFDTYSPGPLEGTTTSYGPTWNGWGGATSGPGAQVTTAQASSAPHSIELPMGTDTVLDFDDLSGGNPMTSGQWTMSAS